MEIIRYRGKMGHQEVHKPAHAAAKYAANTVQGDLLAEQGSSIALYPLSVSDSSIPTMDL